MPSETITLQGNKGILVRQLLHNNTWQAEKLSKWGLTPETAYGCVIHYLFEVRRYKLSSFSSIYSCPHSLYHIHEHSLYSIKHFYR